MKPLSDRIEWVSLYFKGITADDIGKKIAKEELDYSIAIAEAFKLDAIVERLKIVREFMNGETTDRDQAFDKLIEALVIAEALPEVTITIPSDRQPPERVVDLGGDQS